MIFVGNGSFLKNAILHTLKNGYKIDSVYSESAELAKLCNENRIDFKIGNVNEEYKNIEQKCNDKILFSINNGQILRKPLLSLEGFRFYNIHNGILPYYRGLPAVCIIYAILNNEKEYGISLHEIDDGIDTGKCLDILTFPIEEKDTFQSIMLKSIDYCNRMFYKHLNIIVNNTKYKEFKIDKSKSKLYSFSQLSQLHQYKNHPKIKQATNLGVFKAWFKRAADIISAQLNEVSY